MLIGNEEDKSALPILAKLRQKREWMSVHSPKLWSVPRMWIRFSVQKSSSCLPVPRKMYQERLYVQSRFLEAVSLIFTKILIFLGISIRRLRITRRLLTILPQTRTTTRKTRIALWFHASTRDDARRLLAFFGIRSSAYTLIDAPKRTVDAFSVTISLKCRILRSFSGRRLLKSSDQSNCLQLKYLLVGWYKERIVWIWINK